MKSAMDWFPTGQRLQEILELDRTAELDDLFSHSLRKPLDDLLLRPGKGLRGQLVQLGHDIGSRQTGALAAPPSVLARACEILELIHAGSLVVDDIEDGSHSRRGAPAVHILFGLPMALNAGNWLYFLPFEHIEKMELPEARRRLLTRECHRMLLRAHYGQALDVGIPLDSLSQERVREVAMAAIELKSGVLLGFALMLGALVAEASPQLCAKLEKIGRKLGIALQFFDDIGNLTSNADAEKQGEDLRLRRLSFVSAVAAQELGSADYDLYLKTVLDHPTDVRRIEDFLCAHGVLQAARAEAEVYIESVVEEFLRDFDLTGSEFNIIGQIKEQLKSCYE